MKCPNVLFLVSDQHNAKCVGYKNHPDVITPNLDRLAREGVRFDQAITQNPICTPSRVSFLSGQYCHNHGYYGLKGPNPGGLPTVLGHFRRAGYTAGAIGKIHCPEYWVEDDCDCFLEVAECSVGGSPEYLSWLEARGGMKAWRECERRGNPYGGQTLDGFPSDQPYDQSPEGWIAMQTRHFMQAARDGGKPFFLHASLPKPHQAYCPAHEFWDMYDPASLTLPPNFDYDMSNKAPHLREMARKAKEDPRWIEFEPATYDAAVRRKLRGYLGCITHMDHAVGEILTALDELGLADNTIVVYTSDHGDYALEHGIIEKAPGICSDAITRVPMIWRVPGHGLAGHVCEQLVELVDIAPTLCRLCGLEPMATADGKDIGDLLHGGTDPVRDIAVTEFPWSRSIRKGRYRMVFYARPMFADQHPQGFGELYDLNDDPWELDNLYASPAHADVWRQMQFDLMDWLLTTTRVTTAMHLSDSPEHRCASVQKRLRYGCMVDSDRKTSTATGRSPSCNYL